MRRLVAVSTLAVTCWFVPSAAAMTPPPVGLNSIRIVKLTAHKQASCSAQSRKRTGYGRVARKVLPVACEQPPRSKVLDAGLVILFAP
jgi:hypothetical protein